MSAKSLSLLTASGLLSSLLVAAVPSAAQAAPVCADLANCRVVARVDVEGDGKRDVVALGVRRLSEPGAKQITLRVRRASGGTATTTRRLSFAVGGLWRGAAPIDGRRGHELVVRGLTGAHATFSYVFTWRSGGLVPLRSPHGDRLWAADAAAMIVVGWQRGANEKPGILRFREAATPQPNGSWTGSSTTYRWVRGHWQQAGFYRVQNVPFERVAGWGGWRIKGIKRF